MEDDCEDDEYKFKSKSFELEAFFIKSSLSIIKFPILSILF